MQNMAQQSRSINLSPKALTHAERMRTALSITLFWAVALMIGCSAQQIPEPSQGHINLSQKKPPTLSNAIPQPVTHMHFVPKPSPHNRLDTYTVIVDDVPVRELLFSVARDAHLNLDIDTDIEGTVTLNFIDKTLPAILQRITELLPIRYELDGKDLRIRKDRPFLKNYRINYLNMGRTSQSEVTVSTQISATGQGAGSEGGGGSGGDNNSATSVTNESNHQFWDTITANIGAIIAGDEAEKRKAEANRQQKRDDNKEKEKESPSSASGAGSANTGGAAPGNDSNSNEREQAEQESSSFNEEEEGTHKIIVNRESGIIAVHATKKQHREIQKFLDEVMGSIGRQVLIEATIAEVSLSDRYQAGIDWQALQKSGTTGIENFSNPDGINMIQSLTGANLDQAPSFFFRFTENLGENRLDVTLKALEAFGDVTIMSSPKIMALNNQTALLKVVDNVIYFSIEVDTTVSESGPTTTEFDTNIQTVPVGFVMAVTPFIDNLDTVTLNVRPTISRIIGTVQDPNPDLAQAGVVSEIPIIQVREIESILKIRNGETAVIGGLMQDDISENISGVPILSKVPLLGDFFSYKDESYEKTELVIFIRPIVIKDASIDKDLKAFKQYTTYQKTPEQRSH